jgi:hypothetical protein
MCGAEYGGGEGGERRVLSGNDLDGEIPTELGTLTKLTSLCVWPAPPSHLAMWGQLPPEGERRFTGELHRSREGRASVQGVLLGCGRKWDTR